jgi:hypothetical protein
MYTRAEPEDISSDLYLLNVAEIKDYGCDVIWTYELLK